MNNLLLILGLVLLLILIIFYVSNTQTQPLPTNTIRPIPMNIIVPSSSPTPSPTPFILPKVVLQLNMPNEIKNSYLILQNNQTIQWTTDKSLATVVTLEEMDNILKIIINDNQFVTLMPSVEIRGFPTVQFTNNFSFMQNNSDLSASLFLDENQVLSAYNSPDDQAIAGFHSPSGTSSGIFFVDKRNKNMIKFLQIRIVKL